MDQKKREDSFLKNEENESFHIEDYANEEYKKKVKKVKEGMRKSRELKRKEDLLGSSV